MRRPCLVAVSLLVQILTAGLISGQVLTHGPVVGGVSDSVANVFVRTDQAANVALRYGTDPTFETYLVSDTFNTSFANDFTRIIPLANLTAETAYYMNVVVNGVPQCASPPYPSFTTFAPSGTSRTFKFVVLTDFETTWNLTEAVQTFASAAAESPAFVFIGGDFDHRNPETRFAKGDMFRCLYNANTPYMGDFVNLILRRTPIIHQWDDHDSGPNNCDRTYVDWNLTQHVFQEYVPSYPLPSVTPGIWQKFSYAQAECFVLDCRSQRDPERDPDDANKSMLDGNDLGATGELQWLENGLLTSTARWKIVFTSVITNPTTKLPDGWAGYQTEWNALRNFINTNNIQGVVFISGDLHLGAIDNGVAAGFPEMCVSQPNGIHSCPTDPPGTWSEEYVLDGCHGYGLVTILDNPDRLILQTVDEYGNIQLSYTVVAATPTPTPTPTPTAAATATSTPTATATPTATPTATATATAIPTSTPTPAPPSITTQPVNKAENLGETATFRLRATGTPPLQYQWRKNGADIPGAISSFYTTPATVAADDGSLFSVVVSNGGGSVTSSDAILTVRTPPTIATQPVDQTVSVGQRAHFNVTATGTLPLRYQWTKNGVNITGATKGSYTTPPTTAGDNSALFAVTVSNLAGSVTSNNAILTVY